MGVNIDMSLPIMFKAIEAVAIERDMPLDVGDIMALARAAADAETWWDDDQLAERIPDRTTPDSRRAFCARHGIERVVLVNAREVRNVVKNMPGRGWHGPHERETS